MVFVGKKPAYGVILCVVILELSSGIRGIDGAKTKVVSMYALSNILTETAQSLGTRYVSLRKGMHGSPSLSFSPKPSYLIYLAFS